jgi:ATP-binding cassette subfamily C (CFTR/MRP) protein 1
MLRSLFYVHFSETLTGLPTIRSYGGMKRFINANRYYVDLENRALYLVVTNQRQVALFLVGSGWLIFSFRWLAIRLDFMGGMMVFLVIVLVLRVD